MADTNSSYQLPDAEPLDGTEHFEMSQSGNRRRGLLSAVFVAAQTPQTTDPHVSGVLWNNAGNVTISSG